MELKVVSPVLLTGENSVKEGGKYYLKSDFLKEILKEALIYFELRRDKELFDSFYKKLLKLFEDRKREGLKLAGLWLEKKVLCGGEPEIANGKVVNYNEEKNLLNLLNVSDFALEGKTERVKVKQAGRPKRFIGLRVAATEGVFKGEIETTGLEEYEKFTQKPPLFEDIKNGKLNGILDLFSRKVLEVDKEFFANFGYSGAVKFLEEVEGESELLRVNFKRGILPFGAELYCYELIETERGRKELHHLSEIFAYARSKGWSGEIVAQTRFLANGKPVGWLALK